MSKLKKLSPFRDADIFAAIKADRTLGGIAELPRRRQEAVDLLSEVSREGGEVCPSYGPLLPPELGEAPWAPHVTACKR